MLPAVLAGLVGACLFSHDGKAAPQLTKIAAQVVHASATSGAASPAIKLPSSRLDLAAPVAGFERASATEFPVMQRRTMMMDSLRAALPSLGSAPAGTPAARTMSRPEQLAHNFRREGLPVARLFQSENSLVHLGLSPKGKPGLWIIEKLH